MRLLPKFGLMTRAAHDNAILRIEGERDNFRARANDAEAKAQRLELNAKLDRNAITKREEKIAEQSDQITALNAELAKFRAQREKDNAGRRERHARKKAANDVAPKAAKKGAR